MKSKTIEKDIKSKIQDWLSTIEDISLVKDLEKGVIVTGGCIPSMYLKEVVNDYDVYLSDIDLAYRVALYYARKAGETVRVQIHEEADEFPLKLTQHSAKPDLSTVNQVSLFMKSSGIFNGHKKEADEKYFIKFLSSNAITLSHKLQIILRFTGNAEEIHSNYDFAHATSYWTLETGLVTNTKALECILSRELIYRGSKYPLSSIFRTRKFIQRGWSCHVGNYLKMAMQLNELDLTDIEVLKDQLTGVDSAYLSIMIETLSSHEEKITSDYVCKIIDRMMGQSDENN